MTDRASTGVNAAAGFVAAGVACGIKPSGDPDLALVATADGEPVPAAAVFTSNKMTAAPVLTSHAHLAASGGRAAAVVINSGNANAATGARGRADAEAMCDAVAGHLDVASESVLVCSTGLIGIPLPIDTIDSRHPGAHGRVRKHRRLARPPPRRCAPPTRFARRPSPASARRRSAAWRRARRCSPRTWRRCWRCSPPTPWPTRPRCERCSRSPWTPRSTS